MERSLLHRFFNYFDWSGASNNKKRATENSGAASKIILVCALCFFAAFFLLGQAEAPAGVLPDSLKRPEFVTDPLYPRDLSIGELGPGSAPAASYTQARRVLSDLQQAKKTSALLVTIPSETVDTIVSGLEKITPRKFRVGGGQEGVDGSISFMFRFVGREEELSGAVYLRGQEDGSWKLEDIIPEEPRSLEQARQSDNPYLWLPYDRFY
jgi:hypothetical protein